MNSLNGPTGPIGPISPIGPRSLSMIATEIVAKKDVKYENGDIDQFSDDMIKLYKECDNDWYYVLIHACQKGNLDDIKLLIKNNACSIEPNDKSLLHFIELSTNNEEKNSYWKEFIFNNFYIKNDGAFINAAAYGHLDIVKYFISEAVDNSSLQTISNEVKNSIKNMGAFLRSASCGHLDIVKYLIEKTNIKINNLTNTKLAQITSFGHLNMIKYFVEECNIDINIFNRPNSFMYACQNGHLDIIKYFHEAGTDIHIYNDSAFYQACRYNHLNMVKYLHEAGVNIHMDIRMNLSAICEYGHLDIVKYLCEAGIDVHIENDKALRCAAAYGQFDIVNYLINETGADIHAENDAALRQAARNGSVEIVKRLIEEYKLDFNASDDWNVLYSAADGGNLETFKYLISIGAWKINEGKYINNLILQATINHNQLEMIKFICKETNINIHYDDDTPLIWAVKYERLNIIKYLVNEAGANVKKSQALEYAIKNNKTKVIEYLNDLNI